MHGLRLPISDWIPQQVTLTVPGYWVTALAIAALLDSLSTVIVLTFNERAIETRILGAQLIAEYGLIGGMSLAACLVIALFVMAAETAYYTSHWVLTRTLPGRAQWYPQFLRALSYTAGISSSVFFAAWNLFIVL